MTIIKQKAIASDRHGENVRKYLNSKDAVLRDAWNIELTPNWYARMEDTRSSYGHDTPARAGAKNTIMYHQILAFLPEECSCNGGKMTPELCLAFAKEWVVTRYPNQQIVFALHEESDIQGKRYAVHMAINRSDLSTGKRLDEGLGGPAARARASALRELDRKWKLKEVEKDKQNSLIRVRSPREVEKALIEDNRYSYKNNIRHMVQALIDAPSITTLKQFTGKLQSFGVETQIKNGNIYATDVDIFNLGNKKATFNLTKMDARFSVSAISVALEAKQPKPAARKNQAEIRNDYYVRLNKSLVGYYELLKESGEKIPPIKIPKRPASLKNDFKVNQRISEVSRIAERLRAKAIPKDYQSHNLPGRAEKNEVFESQTRQRSSRSREDTHRGGGARHR